MAAAVPLKLQCISCVLSKGEGVLVIRDRRRERKRSGIKCKVDKEVDIQGWLRYACVLEGLGAFCKHKGCISGQGAIWLSLGAKDGVGGHGFVLYCDNDMH